MSVKYFSIIFLFICLFFSVVSAADFTKDYSHYSEEEDIATTLTDFARTEGYSAKISPLVKGTISARFENIKPKDFLDTMSAAFGVKYFLLGKVVNFYHDGEWSQSVYKPSAVSAHSLLQSMENAHVISKDLPISIDANGMMIIQGPDFYVNNIVEIAKNFDHGQENDMVIKIFKLKHSKVSDVVVTTSSRTIVIPGVASILDRMITGSSSAPVSNSMTVSLNSQKMGGLRGTGLSAEQNPQSVPNVVTSNVDDSRAINFTPSIIADERLNAVIINDYKTRMPFYESVIKELDVPVRMVELHAAVVDVDIDASKQLGVSLGGFRGEGNWSNGAVSGNSAGSWNGDGLIQNSSTGGIFSTVFNSSHAHFMAQVKALEEKSLAKTLGRPSVLTLENVEATLESTTTNYVPVSGNESSDLFKVSGGTVLRVTPHIVEDGDEPLIQMIISLQTSQSNDGNDISSVSGSASYIPSVKETTINTQAVVKEGQSLLLGGYYIESNTEKESGVPLLKDIPLLGNLFKSTSNVKSRRERLLLITPKIVTFNDLSNVPSTMYMDFDQSPTSDDYETKNAIESRDEHTPGCSSTRASNGNNTKRINELN